jgi:hypothetical protein
MRTHLLATSGVAALLAAMPAHAQMMTDGAAKRRLGATGRGRARTARRLAVLLLAALFPAWPLPVSAQQTPQLTPLTNPPDFVTITNSSFSGNSADFGGAINNFGTVTITNSSFTNNRASILGGAIDNAGTVSVSPAR